MTDEVRFNVQMPEKLREDAKRNTDRGELSEDVRELFRRKAYGIGAEEQPSELEETKAELEEVRQSIDELRLERSKIDAQIQATENRETRLEEEVTRLQEQREEADQTLTMLENMLTNGERMWPTWIKNSADVDEETAEELYHELRARNDDLPDAAFSEPGPHQPTDWRDAT